MSPMRNLLHIQNGWIKWLIDWDLQDSRDSSSNSSCRFVPIWWGMEVPCGKMLQTARSACRAASLWLYLKQQRCDHSESIQRTSLDLGILTVICIIYSRHNWAHACLHAQKLSPSAFKYLVMMVAVLGSLYIAFFSNLDVNRLLSPLLPSMCLTPAMQFMDSLAVYISCLVLFWWADFL